MFKYVICLAICLGSVVSFAQTSFEGKVIDKETKAALPNANITIEGTRFGAVSDLEGKFTIPIAPASEFTLKISFVGYKTLIQKVPANLTGRPTFELEQSELLGQEVIVFATRASDKTPATFTTVNRKEIQKQNLGQDIPILLDQTPSIVTHSDAGAGIGYTGLRIRGSDATRVNVTVNGIPINDSESHGVFWVNMPDFASSVENIQIQRGVGTSTNGAAAFGASINIQTDLINQEAYAQIDNSVGSFNSWKNTVRVGTGLINDKFTFDARLSRISSDGFLDRARSDLKSFYLSGGYHGKKSLLKLNVFSGAEETYQAWEGTPESRLRGNREEMLAYIDRNGLNEQQQQNLLNSDSRTYNFYEYNNQVDNYQQDHYQLIYALEANPQFTFNAALHYTRGRGYFEQFRFNDRLSNYNLPAITIGDATISRTDLVRRRWLDNHFYGTTFSGTYRPDDKLEVTVGGAWNRYDGDHYGEVMWGRFLGNTITPGDRYYDNNGFKTDFNIFTKANYQLTEKLNLFGDLQLRTINYRFLGFDRNLNNITQEVDYAFFNPKAGATFEANGNTMLYASYSVGNREPVRRDLTESSPDSRPKAESMQNVEAGIRWRNERFSFTANHFLMLYKNQLVITGQVNDVGAYNRTNVDDSYRAGIELDGSFQLNSKWTLAANLAWSKNRIIDFVEFVDDYDAGGQQEIAHGNTNIALSPEWIGGATLAYQPSRDLEIALVNKYVGDQFLDNTSNQNRKLDAFFVQNLRFNYLIRSRHIKSTRFTFMLNNIFDIEYEPNGYTFGYIAGGERVQENFYYPMAGRNFMIGLSFDF